MKLQWLISNGFFGTKYHPDMISSINTSTRPSASAPSQKRH